MYLVYWRIFYSQININNDHRYKYKVNPNGATEMDRNNIINILNIVVRFDGHFQKDKSH